MQGEVDNLNNTIYIQEIKPVINNLSKKKVPGPDGITGDTSNHLRRK